MTSSVEVLRTAPKKLAEAGRTFMREQIKVRLISKVVSQPEFDVLEYPDEESITPKLEKVFSHANCLWGKKFLHLSSYLDARLGWAARC